MKIAIIAPTWDLVLEKRGARVFVLAPRRLDVLPEWLNSRNATLGSKGWPNRCSFCFINRVNRYRQRFRPVRDVVADIERMEDETSRHGDYLVFWDDNISGDRCYLGQLCSAISPFKKKWLAAASVTIAVDKKLLKQLEKS